MPTTENAAIASMTALVAEIETRLLKDSPDYRAMLALKKAIAEVSGPVMHLRPTTERAVAPAPPVAYASGRVPSQPDAVAEVLDQYGPLPTSDILAMVLEMGVTVGGTDKLINLSSAISKSGRFRSFRLNGVPHWYFKDRELPVVRTMPPTWEAMANQNLGGKTGVAAPAAEDSSSSEGGENGDAAA
ncbi:hypothetical protein LRP31_07945 [Mesorhizobium mediterraneum]|uniref:Uncharacterized protein n=1 Tax=Mesorhizobium mediterraneum TaxID=43617 RepID=A0AB36R980_9HYPH|nr:hypothetical protein [Mesorhizobium mediterraneum]PAQ00851.1 hypothetical protein CIT25_18480 [Mesorhizobium mediterraneum]RWN40043.1 MAG: hypothetical protein EOR96_16250 [Mesorhizobium sp.]WIW55156.1 hypothetical protein LRP31_07945 [Mesorhizobium mediterraneum]